MTHDELLAKLNNLPETIGLAEFKVRHDALRAVVEATQLESPAPISAAFGDGWRIAMLTVFDAIEKELK